MKNPIKQTTRRGVALPRALSKLGLASRSEARALVAAGRVRVNGEVVANPAVRVTPGRVNLTIDGTATRPHTTRRVIALNKPRGTVTTRRDPQGRRTVFDVLGEAAPGLLAVGRLDLASTGLLLFTNETVLANWLTDPTTGLVRRYIVTVRGRVEPGTARQLEAGLEVQRADGARERLRAARVAIRKVSSRETHLIVELSEGKNREIRRLFSTAGHEVTRVHRVAFGGFELGDLQPGQWREVDDAELTRCLGRAV